jgi:hypothetical protein
VNTYNVTLKYEDRKVGPEGRTIKVDASNTAGAIGKAARDFVKSLWIGVATDKEGDKEEVTASAASAVSK